MPLSPEMPCWDEDLLRPPFYEPNKVCGSDSELDKKIARRARTLTDPVGVRKHLRKRKHLVQGMLLKQEMAASCHLSRVGRPSLT